MNTTTTPTNPFEGTYDPLMACDAYKLGHAAMYPAKTTRVLANLTARGSRIPDVDAFITFGIQAFIDNLTELWEPFFNADENEVCAWYEHRVTQILGPNNVGSDHIRTLHKEQRLPLRFSALPEGTETPCRVPMVLIENTADHAYWLVNYIETYMASMTWHPMVTATIALKYRRMLDKWAEKTSTTPELVNWQGHDFSARGQVNMAAAAASGAGHLLSFTGSDTLAALDWIDKHYNPQPGTLVLGSVPATEHAVMCAGGQDNEQQTFKRLLDTYPTGILSIVSDTWDLFNSVIGEILPALKNDIITRDGKLVIRPDSGNPANILCGDPDAPLGSLESKGVIEALWDIFGGETNTKGYRELDPHIGAIYGDSITYERANNICMRLAHKGFASTNVVFGIGSFTYQYVTRDTGGFANKTTWVEIDGTGTDVWKDPKTDNGVKKSAIGRLAVLPNPLTGRLTLIDSATPEQETQSLLTPIWENGAFLNKRTTWETITERVGVRTL